MMDRREVFRIPETERVERYYRVESDAFEDGCETVLVAITGPMPFNRLMPSLFEPMQGLDGHWIAVLRVPTHDYDLWLAEQPK